jgi:ATP-binding cassette, subfamily C (CFTR/MRP), member 1
VFASAEVDSGAYVSVARSALIMLVTFIPILASILSFVSCLRFVISKRLSDFQLQITYALTGHDLNIAIIFSSLQLFNVSFIGLLYFLIININVSFQIIRAPLMFFPFVFAALSDAMVALQRISKFLNAEELAEPNAIDYESKNSVKIDGDFTWETAGKLEGNKFAIGAQEKGMRGGTGMKGRSPKGKGEPVLPTSVPTEQVGGTETESSPKKTEEKPFELKNVKFSVPKGAFVAIVGRVWSGKVCSLISIQRFVF